MGHLRLGRLPKTRRWNEVVELLAASPDDTAAVARATILAADRRLRALARDPSLTYCFWLLARLTWAARQGDFTANLSQLGFEVVSGTSTLGFISQVSDHIR